MPGGVTWAAMRNCRAGRTEATLASRASSAACSCVSLAEKPVMALLKRWRDLKPTSRSSRRVALLGPFAAHGDALTGTAVAGRDDVVRAGDLQADDVLAELALRRRQRGRRQQGTKQGEHEEGEERATSYPSGGHGASSDDQTTTTNQAHVNQAHRVSRFDGIPPDSG